MLKNNSLIQYFFISAMAFMLSSCYSFVPSGYYTTSQNVPMMKDKSETQLGFTYGGTHVEGQAAYSPLRNFVVLENLWKDVRWSHGYANETGIGYYHVNKSGFETEAIGLFTCSNQNTHAPSRHSPGGMVNPYFIYNEQYFRSDYTGYSFQLDAGKFFMEKGMQLVFTLKYSYMHYTDFYYLNIGSQKEGMSGGYLTNHVYTLPHPDQQLLIVGMTYKIGGKWIKYILQGAIHMNLDGDTFRANIPPFYNPFIISNIVQFKFRTARKKTG